MYLFLVDDSNEHKKRRVLIKILLQEWVGVNTKMFCWIINVWKIRWIESRVKIMKQEPNKTKKTSLSCFDDKIYILNNDGLALGN